MRTRTGTTPPLVAGPECRVIRQDVQRAPGVNCTSGMYGMDVNAHSHVVEAFVVDMYMGAQVVGDVRGLHEQMKTS